MVLLWMYPNTFAKADDSAAAAMTSPIATGRYEIVASNTMARLTFKLDRYIGKVWQLVESKRGLTWETMSVEGIASYSKSSRARFQIVLSSVIAKIAILIDAVGGKTWLLVTSSVDGISDYTWQQMTQD